MADLWHWRAVYRDGEQIDEYDDAHPEGRGFADVDQGRLEFFLLISQHPDLRDHAVKAVAGPVVFFRRRRIAANVLTDEQHQLESVHCISIAGIYTFLFHDGSILVSDDLDAA